MDGIDQDANVLSRDQGTEYVHVQVRPWKYRQERSRIDEDTVPFHTVPGDLVPYISECSKYSVFYVLLFIGTPQ